MGPTISDMQYEPTMTGQAKWGDKFLSRVVVPLEPARALRRIELPRAPWVRLCGIVLVDGGVAENCLVAVQAKDQVVERETSWWQRLPADTPDLTTLQTFAGGEPAVVARGTHAAFLFDPLTWSGKTNEFSREVEVVEKWINQSMDYLRKAKPAK